MPRARITEGDEMIAKPKKPRASRARVVSSDSEETVTLQSKRSRLGATPVEPDSEVSTRKAPTPIRAHQHHRDRSVRSFFITTAICVGLGAAGVFIGVLDPGAIDVVAVVNERNEKINRGEMRDERTGETLTKTLQVQNADIRPNGGLEPANVADVPVPTVVEVIATSTDATATTTATTTENIPPPTDTQP